MSDLTFRRMMLEVVRAGTCSGCGTCVVVCPYDVLKYEEGKPLQEVLANLPDVCPVSQCIECDICAMVCARLEPAARELDELSFGRPRDPEAEPFGVYRKVLLARTRDPRIAEVAQDGGVVTTLLSWSLEQGIVDGALVSGVDEERPWVPVPRVATSLGDLLACAGSRYCYSPNPLAMIEAVERGVGRLALVGTPCEVAPVGKAKLAGVGEYSDRVVFTIGLLCNEAFTYQGLMEGKIAGEWRLPLGRVKKMNIKGKVLVYTSTGEEMEIPLKEAKAYARPECSFCPDFSAEHADISAGGLGLEGWTLTILRSQRGEELLQGAVAAGLLEIRPIAEHPDVEEKLVKMARRQRRRAEEALKSAVERSAMVAG